MKGVDSNIIVYALNKDLPEHRSCKNLFKKIAEGEEVIAIPSIVFMESYHALVKAYKFKGSKVKERLIAIIDSEYVNVLEISTTTILLAFEIADKFNTGGRDSLIAANLVENNINEIYSHDSDFDKIVSLDRVDPVLAN